MNIPGITRALELDDADWDLAVKLRGLTEHQREQFSAALGPTKSSKKPTERVIEHCAACDYTRRAKVHKDATVSGYHEFQPSSRKPAGKGGGGKSARASGMAQQLNKQLDGRRHEQTEPVIADDSERCQFMSSAGGHCGGTRDDNQHHLYTRADYHQFVAPSATHAATGTGD